MKQVTSFRISKELSEALKKEAIKQNRTVSNLIETILTEAIKKPKK